VTIRKLKIPLIICLGMVVFFCQIYLTVLLTERTGLALSLCGLCGSFPLAVYLAWLYFGGLFSAKASASKEHRTFVKLESAPTARWASMRKNILSAAVIALVLSILFHKSIFFGKGLVPADGIFLWLPWSSQGERVISNHLLRDQYLDFIPQQHFNYLQARGGRLALWNPYLACGTPSLASMQTAVLFPLNLVFSGMNPFSASGPKAFLKLFLAGIFTVLYMRRLGVGRLAATLSGVVFSMCSFMVVWLGHPHVNCAMWLPLLLYFIEGEFKDSASGQTAAESGLRQALPRWAGFAVTYGFMVLGGHPPTIVHVSIFIAGYFFFRLAFCRQRQLLVRRALLFFFGIGCGLLLAGAQVIPFLEYYRESSSALSSAALDRGSFHLRWSSLMSFFVPHACGSPTRGFLWLLDLVPSDYSFNERTMFVGIVPLCLSLFAVCHRRSRGIVRFYFVVLLICMATVLGLWPIPWLLGQVPVLNSISHIRLILIICFSLAVLAGLGLEALREIRSSTKWKLLAVVWLIAGFFIWWFFGRFKSVLTGADQEIKRFVFTQLHVFFAGLLVASILIGYPAHRRKVLPKVLALVWVCFELLWFARGYNPSISREDYYPETDSIRFLKADDTLFRIASLDGILPPNTALMYGLYDVRGEDFMSVRRYEELITGRAGKFFFYSPSDPLPPNPSLVNVKYMLVANERQMPVPPVYRGAVSVYRVEPFVERAVMAYDYQVLREKKLMLENVGSESFDPREKVFFEKEPEFAAGKPELSQRGAFSDVDILEYYSDEVTIKANTDRAGFLVLLDTYFAGWQAFVNGKRTEIYRANYNFRAVVLDKGRSVVRFVYRPVSFSVGCCLSLTGVVVLIFSCVASRRNRRVSA